MLNWVCELQTGLNWGLAKQGSVSGGSGELFREGAPEIVVLSLPGDSSAPSKTPNFLATLRALVDEILTPEVSRVLNERCADISQCQGAVRVGLLQEGHKAGDHAQGDTVPPAAGHRPPTSEGQYP